MSMLSRMWKKAKDKEMHPPKKQKYLSMADAQYKFDGILASPGMK